MTTTELIELLKRYEKGGISHKPREISLTINGKYMSNPQISLSSTGDGICGAEIDLDIEGDFFIEEELSKWIPIKESMPIVGEDVLVCDLDGNIYITSLHLDGRWGFDEIGNKIKNVVAWMELPPSYKAENEVKEMNDSFEFTLNSPLTKEDWDKIMDVELENTPSVTFQTPKGKQVKYIKADTLDKISAEIEKIKPIDYDGTCIDRAYVLKIIDKYKAESGGEE